MALGPFFVGQIPKNPLTLKVKDARSNADVPLDGYTSAEIVMVAPNGAKVDTSGGVATVNEDADVVTYAWPGTTLFAQAGTYRLQVLLKTGSATDITGVEEFEVRKAL